MAVEPTPAINAAKPNNFEFCSQVFTFLVSEQSVRNTIAPMVMRAMRYTQTIMSRAVLSIFLHSLEQNGSEKKDHCE